MLSISRKMPAAAVLASLLSLHHALANLAEDENLVRNGDFAEVENGKPVAWETSGNPQTVAQTLEVFEEGGNRSAKLTCTRCEGSGGWTHAMLCQVGGVGIREGRNYRFSCRARADGLEGGTVSVSLQDTDGWKPCGLNTSLAVGKAWNSYSAVFKALRTAHKSTRLQFWHNEPGVFCLDDVAIVEMREQKVRFTNVVPDAGSKNMAPNGSFEAGASGWSSLGRGAGWGNLAELHGRIETGGAPHGARFLSVPLGGKDTPLLCFDYYEPVVAPQLQTLASNIGWIEVEKGAQYTLSCMMRSSVDGVGAVLGVRAKDPARERWDRRDYRRDVKLTTSWKSHSFTFRPEYPFVFVTLGPNLRQAQSVRVDIDAVQLEKGDKATGFEPRLPIELGIEPSEPAGVFTAGGGGSLLVIARNHGDSAAGVRVEFEAADFFDKPARMDPAILDIPARSTMERKLAAPPEWKGFYRVRAAWKSGGREVSTVLPLAIVPPRGESETVLGINHAFVAPRLMRLAGKAGISWYRDWSLKWQHIEPEPGVFKWDVSDPQIDRVLKEGFKVMALLPPFPSAEWNSEAPAGIPKKGYPAERLAQAWAPRDPAKLGEFAAKAVTRYRDRVKTWEFLNEPIYTTYALPGKDKEPVRKYGGRFYEPSDYVRLLDIVSAQMKKADPQCRVMGGIGGGPDTLTREVISAGCLKRLDIFNLHIYPGAAPPEGFSPAMNRLLAEMDSHGGRKPIWITEFSYYGADNPPREPFVPDGNDWAEERLLKSERECAEFTVRFVIVMLARGVEKIFIHSGASGAVNEASLECCLFGYGGTPRKTVPALAALAGLLGPAPKFVSERRVGDSCVSFAFETGKRAVVALWRPGAGDAAVKIPRGAECLDIVGNRVEADEIRPGSAPLYVLGRAGTAAELAGSLR